MFKNLSKLEKAGLLIGTIECVAGLGMAIYGMVGYKKAMNELQEIKDMHPNLEDIEFPTIDDLMNKED